MEGKSRFLFDLGFLRKDSCDSSSLGLDTFRFGCVLEILKLNYFEVLPHAERRQFLNRRYFLFLMNLNYKIWISGFTFILFLSDLMWTLTPGFNLGSSTFVKVSCFIIGRTCMTGDSMLKLQIWNIGISRKKLFSIALISSHPDFLCWQTCKSYQRINSWKCFGKDNVRYRTSR